MPALALPLFWGAVSATAAGTAGIVGAKMASNASQHAADLQSAGADKTLAFEKDQAAQQQANFEATQHANYDQWAAHQRSLSTLGQLAGLAPRQIPAYVPTTPGGSPTPGGPGGAAPTGGPMPSGPGAQNPQAYFQSLVQGKPPTPQSLVSLEPQLNQQGIKVLRNASGVAGKIQLPTGQIVDVIQAAGLGGQGWQWMTGGGAPSGQSVGSVGSYLLPNPSVAPTAQAPLTPRLPMPGTVGSYLGANA